ncbi:hypothetical protein SRABI118_01828 [Massilia sp. Bi118]|uniref:type ISP restriction/modification enzyme n=1 Tax=Massilia sp. Bi118 TaxID=2822346 RepID=UPI001D30EAB1|nr:type ISP restriction/modification enzyme [Massilia sp. Bi118]CAH0204738.1 hypothetical protein SRABI118_01828 [Massilia sp. Bi118]
MKTMTKIFENFADSIQKKFLAFTNGEPEDQLRSPFESLIQDFGAQLDLNVIPIGETKLAENLGRPDFGIEVEGILCGHVELKAPGKGANPKKYKGHDKQQWDRFRALPNILYTDAIEWRLFRAGEEVRTFRFNADPCVEGGSVLDESQAAALKSLLHDFLTWNPIVPTTSKQLALYLAPLCRMLKDDVLDALKSGSSSMMGVARDWRNYLFPDASNEEFSDSYAQTVTFALLLARSNGANTLFIDDAIHSLSARNTLLGKALQVLTDEEVEGDVRAPLSMLKRVIKEIPAHTMTKGRRDPWLHFYEDFLQEYDPKLRKDVGAYYTPLPVVHAQVRIVDDILRNRLNKPMGFAEGGVTTLDPAVGTGTYLLAVVEEAMPRVVEEEGPGAARARASLLAQNLFGFELMVGPYAVGALRMTRLLQDFGAGIPQDGVQVFLSNTLESPFERMPELPMMYLAIGKEHQRAKRVKETVPVFVCLGNPPYDRHAKATSANKMSTGGWVRWGESKDGKDAILNDFIEPVKKAGKGGQLKNLYNLYTYFWRWALWKVFEQPFAQAGGIVAFITASSFLDGDAFLGMRAKMRELCDEIWIIDLGGDGRGTQKEENVFAIQTPVAITIAIRKDKPNPKVPARVQYTRIRGERSEKFAKLEAVRGLADLKFEECPSDWIAPMRPAEPLSEYFTWPSIVDLMPWHHSGSQLKRNWPISAYREVLVERWKLLLNSSDRSTMFRESRDRTVKSKLSNLVDSHVALSTIAELPNDAPHPPIVRYGFRSFDRQYVILDNRVGDYFRPALWRSVSEKQIFFATLTTNTLSLGPALTASIDVPDLHFFRGSFGAKDVIPLYRDEKATQPNIHPELLTLISSKTELRISVDDWACYLFAVTGHSGYVRKFRSEIEARELRIPITLKPNLFSEAVEAGRRLIHLYTYGERFEEMLGKVATGKAKCVKAISESTAPTSFSYDEINGVLIIGDGKFSPVSFAQWNFEVSGNKILQSWIGNRLAVRPGKKTSELDNVGPRHWGAHQTSELLQLLWILESLINVDELMNDLLQRIVASPTLLAIDLSEVPAVYRTPPKDTSFQHVLLDE